MNLVVSCLLLLALAPAARKPELSPAEAEEIRVMAELLEKQGRLEEALKLLEDAWSTIGDVDMLERLGEACAKSEPCRPRRSRFFRLILERTPERVWALEPLYASVEPSQRAALRAEILARVAAEGAPFELELYAADLLEGERDAEAYARYLEQLSARHPDHAAVWLRVALRAFASNDRPAGFVALERARRAPVLDESTKARIGALEGELAREAIRARQENLRRFRTEAEKADFFDELDPSRAY